MALTKLDAPWGDAVTHALTQECCAKIVALGVRYDAEPAFPALSLAVLAKAGINDLFEASAEPAGRFQDVLAKYGAMFEVLRLVGRADLSIGRLLEGHINAMELLGWYGNEAQIAGAQADVKRGQWYGVWATELPPGVEIGVKGDTPILVGRKCFASGAGGLAKAIVTVRAKDGGRHMVLTPANDSARADTSNWRVRGMRSTVSGTYDLTGVRFDPADIVGSPADYDAEPRFTAGAWRFLAVQLGGIEALLSEVRAVVRSRLEEDPVARSQFSNGIVATRTAYLWVRQSMMRAAHDQSDAVPLVQMARGVVERAALDVKELGARLVGTRHAFTGERIDKIDRDLSLYLRQAGPDHARDQAASSWIDSDRWSEEDALW